MIYRVLKPLSTGHIPGQCVTDARFKPGIVERLLANNAITPVQGPPLAEIQGWTRRAEILESVGIVNAVDFLDAADDVIQGAFGHKTNRAVVKYKEYIRKLLSVEITEPKNG